MSLALYAIIHIIIINSYLFQVDLEKLKGDVKVVLNDSFFEKLGEVVEIVEARTSSGTSTAGFLQAIIRRSKRLALLHT